MAGTWLALGIHTDQNKALSSWGLRSGGLDSVSEPSWARTACEGPGAAAVGRGRQAKAGGRQGSAWATCQGQGNEEEHGPGPALCGLARKGRHAKLDQERLFGMCAER